jgi:hypothetical protein
MSRKSRPHGPVRGDVLAQNCVIAQVCRLAVEEACFEGAGGPQIVFATKSGYERGWED